MCRLQHVARSCAVYLACAFLPWLGGCATTSQSETPRWSAANPHPDPQTEYNLAVQEYNEALKTVEMAKDSQGISQVNKDQGAYQGSRQAQALGVLLDVTNVLASNDAAQRLAAAKQRLRHAEAVLRERG